MEARRPTREVTMMIMRSIPTVSMAPQMPLAVSRLQQQSDGYLSIHSDQWLFLDILTAAIHNSILDRVIFLGISSETITKTSKLPVQCL